MSTVKREFSTEAVLAYIQENRGIRYMNTTLARNFGVKTVQMKVVLDRLIAESAIHSSTDGKSRHYYLRASDELTEADLPAPRLHTSPMQGYEKMMRDIAAAAEKGR